MSIVKALFLYVVVLIVSSVTAQTNKKNRQLEPIFVSLLWQPHLALLNYTEGGGDAAVPLGHTSMEGAGGMFLKFSKN